MNNNEPIILGNVKKGKTGKPIVVVIIFLFIGVIILFLPILLSYFGDYSILDLIKNGEIIDFFINHEYYMNKDNIITTTTSTQKKESNDPILINNKAVIEYNNFTLSNFNIEKDKITLKITTSNTINFDNSNYYLVLSKNNKELLTLKLIGEITKEGEMTLLFKEEIDSIVDVKGIIKQINKDSYPNILLSTDESGLGTIICSYDENEIEYTFSNGNLISIKDTYRYIDKNDGNYITIFQQYVNKSNKLNNLGATSTITEDSISFTMTTNIDLSTYQYNNNDNTNYYSLNTEAKVINFEMEAKGFDCK